MGIVYHKRIICLFISEWDALGATALSDAIGELSGVQKKHGVAEASQGVTKVNNATMQAWLLSCFAHSPQVLPGAPSRRPVDATCASLGARPHRA